MLLEDNSHSQGPMEKNRFSNQLPNANFQPEKAEKRRRGKVCASQKSQELCYDGRAVVYRLGTMRQGLGEGEGGGVVTFEVQIHVRVGVL